MEVFVFLLLVGAGLAIYELNRRRMVAENERDACRRELSKLRMAASDQDLP